AVANILFGEANPSGKLPITFPASESDQPPPGIVAPPPGQRDSQKLKAPIFDVKYTAGLNVGYKWYDAEHKQVLFPFGYGLSYTTFSYSGIKVDPAGTSVGFTLKNTGTRDGEEVAEVYAGLPAGAGEPPKRLVGWAKVPLKAGESREVSVKIDPLYLKIFDEGSESWELVPGSYDFMVGGSSRSLPLTQKINLQ
ncbi:MAG TPA: fibronectin type III-like domain-contianing protein, partial [Candidatus Acidoferrales bacterium]|nr:fibronectin type III-like domain-contianing protein [Candidatus Acidoferrales bacterium]